MNIGVIGFSGQSFDIDDAKDNIKKSFDMFIDPKYKDISVVSGLTNVGIPKLAYEEATRRGWKTVGIACSLEEEYECFPVDKTTIVGDQWGDESEEFLDSIDVLLKFGGGKQSEAEFKKANDMGTPTFEYGVEK